MDLQIVYESFSAGNVASNNLIIVFTGIKISQENSREKIRAIFDTQQNS
jgi:hypothetical protein